MKKINVLLTVALAILLAAWAYFALGTNMKVRAAASAEGNSVRCQVSLANGSIIPMECIEFIALSPTGARITESAGEGEDVPALSEREMAFTLEAENPAGAQVEIGYYVLGTRKTVTVTLK